MEKQRSNIRWLYLVVGTAALLFAGIIYGWSILKAPLAEEFGWSASALSLNFTLTMCCFCVGGMLGGALNRRLGLRIACIISAVLSAVGFLLASTMQGSIGLLYLSYGVLAGLGIGIAYNCVISTVNAWFPDKKGLCSGVLMMGFGASALIIGSAADSMIQNPALGWRGAFRIIGIALGVVLVLCALVLRKVPANSAPGAAAKAEGKPAASERSITTADMLKSATFWKAFLLLVFLAAVGNTVISMAKDLALSVGVAAGAATTLVGILSVCNGFGRVLTGIIFDRFGRKTTMLTANIMTICAAGITLLSIVMHSAVLGVAGLCLTGLSYGTCPTISSAFISEVFGPEYFAMNFAVMNCNLIFASFIATGLSLVNAATGGYSMAFVLLLALSAVALLLNLSLRKAD